MLNFAQKWAAAQQVSAWHKVWAHAAMQSAYADRWVRNPGPAACSQLPSAIPSQCRFASVGPVPAFAASVQVPSFCSVAPSSRRPSLPPLLCSCSPAPAAA